MKKSLIFLAVFLVYAAKTQCVGTAPLELVDTYHFPADVKGEFEGLAVDVRGHRLFTTPKEHKSVEIFDLSTGKLIQSIRGFQDPHVVFYREDLNRIYVTDADAGELKIFDGKTYGLIKTVKLLLGADEMTYDPTTKYLYVANGGHDMKMTFSNISIVDSTSGKKLADIKIDGDNLQEMAMEISGPRIYVDNLTKNRVEKVDRNRGSVLASWPITLGKTNVGIALDEANHRLFVACRSGQIVVFDTETGAELQALPIAKNIDDLVFDPKSKRLYAPCGEGSVDVYEETDPDHYRLLGKVSSGVMGRTGLLVPELKRYFVTVPNHGDIHSVVLVYKVQ